MGVIYPKPLACPLCGEERKTRGGMFWHCKLDHDLNDEEAFETAGQAEMVEVYPK